MLLLWCVSRCDPRTEGSVTGEQCSAPLLSAIPEGTSATLGIQVLFINVLERINTWLTLVTHTPQSEQWQVIYQSPQTYSTWYGMIDQDILNRLTLYKPIANGLWANSSAQSSDWMQASGMEAWASQPVSPHSLWAIQAREWPESSKKSKHPK